MSADIFMVTKYKIYNFSSEPTRKTFVYLIGADGFRCSVWFWDGPVPLPPPTKLTPKLFVFYYHHRQLEHFIDVFRNEKPVYVRFSPGMPNRGIIETAFEPIGEEEGLESALKDLEP